MRRAPLRRRSALWRTAWESGRLQQAVATSLERGVVGFLIAIVVGTPIGLLLAEVRPLRRAVGPIISGLQVLPSVAWVPAAIIWFGLSDATVYFVILMGAIPSIVNGLIAGVDQVPPQLRRVGTVLGASARGSWRPPSSFPPPCPATSPGSSRAGRSRGARSWPPRSSRSAARSASASARCCSSRANSPTSPACSRTILLILFIGILIELLFFGPLERRMLRRRGLLLSGGAR